MTPKTPDTRTPMERYVAALEDLRMYDRWWGATGKDPRLAEARKAGRDALAAMSDDERATAEGLAWLASVAAFDARTAAMDAAGVPVAEQPRKFFWDIPAFPRAHYEVDVEWKYLEDHLVRWQTDMGLNLDPDYQRAHVWTETQQRLFVEHILQGGEVGLTLIFNHEDWDGMRDGAPFTLLDGKQRLTAARKFMADELAVFGRTLSQWSGSIRMVQGRFRFRVLSLKTREEVLRLYLSINAGGTPHTAEELAKVRAMLEAGR